MTRPRTAIGGRGFPTTTADLVCASSAHEGYLKHTPDLLRTTFRETSRSGPLSRP
jgi:hypothetical protein